MSGNEMSDTLLEILYTELFHSVPRYISLVAGEGPAMLILRESAREATLKLLSENSKLKSLMENLESDEERLGLCYRLMEDMGIPYEYRIVDEDPQKLTVQVYKCPHIHLIKENPIACNTCMGMRLAIIEVLFGIRQTAAEPSKRMSYGDEYCEYTVPRVLV